MPQLRILVISIIAAASHQAFTCSFSEPPGPSMGKAYLDDDNVIPANGRLYFSFNTTINYEVAAQVFEVIDANEQPVTGQFRHFHDSSGFNSYRTLLSFEPEASWAETTYWLRIKKNEFMAQYPSCEFENSDRGHILLTRPANPFESEEISCGDMNPNEPDWSMGVIELDAPLVEFRVMSSLQENHLNQVDFSITDFGSYDSSNSCGFPPDIELTSTCVSPVSGFIMYSHANRENSGVYSFIRKGNPIALRRNLDIAAGTNTFEQYFVDLTGTKTDILSTSVDFRCCEEDTAACLSERCNGREDQETQFVVGLDETFEPTETCEVVTGESVEACENVTCGDCQYCLDGTCIESCLEDATCEENVCVEPERKTPPGVSDSGCQQSNMASLFGMIIFFGLRRRRKRDS